MALLCEARSHLARRSTVLVPSHPYYNIQRVKDIQYTQGPPSAKAPSSRVLTKNGNARSREPSAFFPSIRLARLTRKVGSTRSGINSMTPVGSPLFNQDLVS
ncbi:hypothetical protein M3J09_001194 [Ascochyta lentis]